MCIPQTRQDEIVDGKRPSFLQNWCEFRVIQQVVQESFSFANVALICCVKIPAVNCARRMLQDDTPEVFHDLSRHTHRETVGEQV